MRVGEEQVPRSEAIEELEGRESQREHTKTQSLSPGHGLGRVGHSQKQVKVMSWDRSQSWKQELSS